MSNPIVHRYGQRKGIAPRLLLPAGIHKPGKIIDVFNDDLIGIDLQAALGNKMAEDFPGLGYAHAGPMGNIVHGGFKVPRFGSTVHAGLGFLHHKENIGDFSLGLLQGQDHKPAFGIIYPLGKHPQEF